jgi:hypothetical protein
VPVTCLRRFPGLHPLVPPPSWISSPSKVEKAPQQKTKRSNKIIKKCFNEFLNKLSKHVSNKCSKQFSKRFQKGFKTVCKHTLRKVLTQMGQGRASNKCMNINSNFFWGQANKSRPQAARGQETARNKTQRHNKCTDWHMPTRTNARTHRHWAAAQFQVPKSQGTLTNLFSKNKNSTTTAGWGMRLSLSELILEHFWFKDSAFQSD